MSKRDRGATPNTETQDQNLADLDLRATHEIVGTLISSYNLVLATGTMAKPQLTELVEVATELIGNGGRMIYVGAGSAGMIAQLDAAELSAVFGIDEQQVVAIVAGENLPPGGPRAALEDDAEAGGADIRALSPGPSDLVVGVSASGGTLYVLGALEAAADAGATTAAIVSELESPLGAAARHVVEIPVGPEVIAGSSRLKAGSAQKLVLNTLSTATMVKLGRTYGNLMVAFRAENEKLRRRAVEVCVIATGCDPEDAGRAIEAAGGDQRIALVMLLADVDSGEAASLLERNRNSVRGAIHDR